MTNKITVACQKCAFPFVYDLDDKNISREQVERIKSIRGCIMPVGAKCTPEQVAECRARYEKPVKRAKNAAKK